MPQITSGASKKSAIRQGQQTALGMKCLEHKVASIISYIIVFFGSVTNHILFSDNL